MPNIVHIIYKFKTQFDFFFFSVSIQIILCVFLFYCITWQGFSKNKRISFTQFSLKNFKINFFRSFDAETGNF